MGILLYSEISDITLDRIQANVATDPPFTAAQIQRHLNDAYSDIFTASGGGYKTATGTTMWTGGGVASTATSFIHTGLLQNISEVLHVWASTGAGSVGASDQDIPLDRVDESTIRALRGTSGVLSGIGTYLNPKVFAIIRRAQPADTSGNLLDLMWWPSAATFYFPAAYIEQFDPFDGGASDVPNVGDAESRDIALLAAARMAPLIGRAELVPSIIMDLSARTQKAMAKKLSAMLGADQDR